MSKCALCGQDKPLRKSHVISKFIFDYMKETSAVENTRFKRPLENINKVYQDGDKLPLLCHDCEQMFGIRENYFKQNIFLPFQEGALNSGTCYDEKLCYFLTSISWRTLYLELGMGFSDPIHMDMLEKMIEAEQIMRDYLLGQRSDLDYIENHIFFWDLVEDTSKEIAENNPNSFFRRTVYGYTTVMDGNSVYIQTNMMGIMAVTILKKHKEDLWENTYININGGKVSIPQNVRSVLGSDWMDYLKENREIKMPENQQDKLTEKLKNNPERALNSQQYALMQEDQKLKEKAKSK